MSVVSFLGKLKSTFLVLLKFLKKESLVDILVEENVVNKEESFDVNWEEEGDLVAASGIMGGA